VQPVSMSERRVKGLRAAVKGADMFLQKSRNASIDSHTIVQNGDDLGRIVFQGSNGTTFDTGAIIMAEVDGKPGASADKPTRLVFLTAPEPGPQTAQVRTQPQRTRPGASQRLAPMARSSKCLARSDKTAPGPNATKKRNHGYAQRSCR
jgi:hypothetical protein